MGKRAICFLFVSGKRGHVVVKAGNGDAPVFVAQPGEQLAEGQGGIVHRAAVDAGMQIAGRPAQGDFHGADAAQGISEGGMIQAGHAGVGNDHGAAMEFLAIGQQEAVQTLAADFLLAFDDEGEIAGERGLCGQISFDRVEMGEVLAFVVAGAAGEEGPAFDARLEGRAFPKFKRLGRLDIVMAVDKKGRFGGTGRARRLGDDDRMAVGGAKPGFQADFPAVRHQPLRARDQIAAMSRLGGDAGKTQVVTKPAEEARLVLLEIIQHSLH